MSKISEKWNIHILEILIFTGEYKKRKKKRYLCQANKGMLIIVSTSMEFTFELVKDPM